MKLINVKRKKGQAAITDLFVALAIFIVLIIVTTTIWNLYNVRLRNRMAYDDIAIKSFQVSDILLKTGGNPLNWNSFYWDDGKFSQVEIDNIIYPGLIERDLFVPYEKIKALEEFNESNIKEVFHSGRYNFGIRVINSTGEVIYNMGHIGGNNKFSINLAKDIMFQKSAASNYERARIEVMLSK
jgi:hypothetical protein